MSQGDQITLQQDGVLFEPLSRVAHRSGMMLGVEAVRDEQAYNRRRLNRHDYWLHGAGTVVGLAVTLEHRVSGADPDNDHDMELQISPGVALDGFGREIVLHEPYCLDFRAWIESKRDPDTREWDGSDTHVPQQGGLWLQVSIRQQDCERGLQQVIAHKVNSTIDPVATSRIEEGVWLDIRPITPADPAPNALATPTPPTPPTPGARHPGSPPDLDGRLTATEKTYLGNLSGMAAELAGLYADRLFRLADSQLNASDIDQELDRMARVPLARMRLETLDQSKLVSHPARVQINNLIRPFVAHPDVLRWVLQQHAQHV